MEVQTCAERFVEALVANQTRVIFLNPGTDTAPVLEALSRRSESGLPSPRVVLCAHEAVALAAAHGYFAVTGEPQVVMVHVDVGTQNLGAMLHNVARGEAGVVIFAGRTPYASYGQLPGGRDRPVHWQQDVPDQNAIVRPYVKATIEVISAEMVDRQVNRAFQLARTQPVGAVYLTAARETLMAPVDHQLVPPDRYRPPAPPGANHDEIQRVATLAAAAQRPVIVTERVGRDPDAVAALVRLAERLDAPVVDRRERMNLPSSHPLSVLDTDRANELLRVADLVLVVDCTVPWVPAQVEPPSSAAVVHIGIDPVRVASPNWDYPVDVCIDSDPALALRALTDALSDALAGR